MASNLDFTAESHALSIREAEVLSNTRQVQATDRLRFPVPEDAGSSSSRFKILAEGGGESLSIAAALFKLMRLRYKTKLRLNDATSFEAFEEKLRDHSSQQAGLDKSESESESEVSDSESSVSRPEVNGEGSDDDESTTSSGELVAAFQRVFGVDVRVIPGNKVYKYPLIFGSGDASGNAMLTVGHVYKRLYVPLGEVVTSGEADADLKQALVEQVAEAIRLDINSNNGAGSEPQGAGDSASQRSEQSQAEARASEINKILDFFEGVQEYDDCEPSKDNVNVELKRKLEADPVKYRLCFVKFLGREHGAKKVGVPVHEESDGLKKIYLSNPGTWRQDVQVLVEVTERKSPDQASGSILGAYLRNNRYQFLPRDVLVKNLAEQPNKFKRCILDLNGVQGGSAEPVDRNDPITRIELTGRENCGRACNNDEVVVEVMGQDPATKEFKGRVVGVYKQAEKLRHQLFLCEVLSDPGTLMRPLCGTFPKICYDNTVAQQQHKESDRLEDHENRVQTGQVPCNMNSMDYERINRDYISVFTPRKDSRGRIFFVPKRSERVNKEFCESVFLVAFEFWHQDRNYPIGKVIHILNSDSNDLVEVFNLIQMRHRLPRPLRETAEIRKQVAKIANQAKQPRLKDRVDFRSVPTVTIDNPDTRDMDDAISYSRSPKTGVETVGVHITDVCEHLLPNSLIDKLAKSRLRTIYPPKSSDQQVTPNHMLPRSLSEEILSLKEGQDRLCLSVIFKFKRDETRGQLTWEKPEFRQTVIRSDLRLNKIDVQPVLLETERNPDTFGRISESFVHMLRALWGITKRLRLMRLGEAGFTLQNEECDDDGEGIGKTFETAYMIEELMVLANLSVGQWLADGKQAVVARVQDKPRPAGVEEWLKKYEPVLVHMPRLQRDLKVIKCKYTIRDFPLSLTKIDFEFISKYYRGKTRDCVLRLMSDSRHPHMMLALGEWFSVCQIAGYVPTQLPVTSGQAPPPPPYHFSLQQTNYVHFTSPMRRYADIVVHRAFRAQLQGKVVSPDGLGDICDSLRTLERRAKQFDKDSASHEFASRLKRRPQQEFVVIKSIDEAEVAFTNGRLRRLPKSVSVLKMSSFGLDARPQHEQGQQHKFRFRWSRRIFVHPSCEDPKRYFTQIQRRHGSEVRICRDAYVTRIKCEPVRQLRKKFIESGADYASVRADFQRLQDVLKEDKGTFMVTCESDQTTNQLLVAGNAVTFYREMSIGDIIKVQFRAQIRQGLLSPAVALIEVCESHSVCVSHKDDPVRCFAEVTDVKSKSSYRDINEYAQTWQRIVAIESATIASRSDDSITLHEVGLDWTFHKLTNRWLGAFHLPQEFCMQRQIKVGSDSTVLDPHMELKLQELEMQHGRGGGRSVSEDALNEAFELAGERSRYSDFLCLRFQQQPDQCGGREGHVGVAHGGILLVYHTAHGRNPKCSARSRADGASCHLVVFALQQHDQTSRFEWTGVQMATVEVLQKFLPIRRQELALWKLPKLKSDSLAHKVSLLGTQAARVEDLSYSEKLREKDVKSYSIVVGKEERYSDYTQRAYVVWKRIPCNEVQNKAITDAMKYDLTLIWGPPGTGKTSTGVMLTYWYVFVNRCFDENQEEIKPDDETEDATDNGVEPEEDENVEQALIDYGAFDRKDKDDGWDGTGEAVRRSLAEEQADLEEWNTVGHDGRVVRRARTSSRFNGNSSRGSNGSKAEHSGRMFAAENLNARDEDLQRRRQVLYCGPSNRSVDVVAEYLQLKLDAECPKIVRVFSEQAEQRKYPVPGDGSHSGQMAQDADSSPTMEKIALHNFIRETYNSKSALLLQAFDVLFGKFLAEEFKNDVAWRKCLRETAGENPVFHKFLQRLALDLMRRRAQPDNANGGLIEYDSLDLLYLTTVYKKIVTVAKKIVLQFFEVILCTTSVSCSSVLQSACKFTQIIIDEAGMCTEPETLVPLVGFLSYEGTGGDTTPASHFAERLVLIGDHKQLSPIIENRTAEQLGLGTSLFERHSHRAVMLSMQYRMHPSLAEFSADYFYKTGSAHLQTRESPTWTSLQKGDDILSGDDFPRWNGINTHELAKDHVYDSFNASTGSQVRGKLRNENSNILFGCWPGIRRAKDFGGRHDSIVYSSDRRIHPRDLHPKGEEDRIVFLHVEGFEERVTVSTEEGSEDSRKNEAEICEVIRVYEALRSRAERPRIFSESLAVLSQYRYQVSSIAERIRSELKVKSPFVKTVIASQGSEFDYVILSLVRSLPDFEIPKFPLPSWESRYLGFITDANQINVALTRARKGLIIIGNQNLLRANNMWRELLTHLDRNSCVVASPQTFPEATGDKRASTRDGNKPQSDGYSRPRGGGGVGGSGGGAWKSDATRAAAVAAAAAAAVAPGNQSQQLAHSNSSNNYANGSHNGQYNARQQYTRQYQQPHPQQFQQQQYQQQQYHQQQFQQQQYQQQQQFQQQQQLQPGWQQPRVNQQRRDQGRQQGYQQLNRQAAQRQQPPPQPSGFVHAAGDFPELSASTPSKKSGGGGSAATRES